jgi:hypothetical protein
MTIRMGKVNFDAASQPASMSSARARQGGREQTLGLLMLSVTESSASALLVEKWQRSIGQVEFLQFLHMA